ncbi:MAG: hypothetical protein V1743_02230 [Nanoarchaeota archaeon]
MGRTIADLERLQSNINFIDVFMNNNAGTIWDEASSVRNALNSIFQNIRDLTRDGESHYTNELVRTLIAKLGKYSKHFRNIAVLDNENPVEKTIEILVQRLQDFLAIEGDIQRKGYVLTQLQTGFDNVRKALAAFAQKKPK